MGKREAKTIVRVFLAHSSADDDLALRITNRLRDRAISIWFDKIELRGSDPLLPSIRSAIGATDVLAVLVTENSSKSDWVEKEVGIARRRKVRVLPLIVEGSSIPKHISGLVHVTIKND